MYKKSSVESLDLQFDSPHGILNYKRYISACLCLALSLPHAIEHSEYLCKWGIPVVWTFENFFNFTAGLPLFMVFSFFGNYTRRSFITYWEMFPLFKGLGYIMIFNITSEIISNLMYANIAIMFLCLSFTVNVPWKTCNFKGAHSDCYPIAFVRNFTRKCCTSRTNCTTHFRYSTLDYFEKFTFIADENISPPFIGKWVIVTIFVCSVVFFFATIDSKKFYNILTSLAGGIGCFAIPVSVIGTLIAAYSGNKRPKNFDSKMDYVFNPEVWVKLFLTSVQQEIPGEYIYLGSISSHTLYSTISTLVLYFTKAFASASLDIWLIILVCKMTDLYNVHDTLCIESCGVSTFFVLIPHLLTTLRYHQGFLIIWYIILYIWTNLTAVSMFRATIHTVLQAHPFLINHEFKCCAVYALFIIGAITLMLNRKFVSMYQIFKKGLFEWVITIYSVCSILSICAYSTLRFENDFHFYGKKPIHKLWISAIKICILNTMIMLVMFYITHNVKEITINPVHFWSMLSVMFLPFISLLVYNGVKYTLKNQPLTQPGPDWGPEKKIYRPYRRAFYPQRKTRFVTKKIRCTHQCLIGSQKLRELIEAQKKRREHLKHENEFIFH